LVSLRFAIFGAGFWSRFQLAAWKQIGGVDCVAVYNRTRAKADALAREFDVPAIYDDPEELLKREGLDFVDIITDVNLHSDLVHLAAAYKLPTICQKPMGASLQEAEAMTEACREAGVPFFVHENWRWQTPIRKLKEELTAGKISVPFRARVQFCSSFPVFENQPFLKDLEQFILTDIGSHILDTARFLFGEAESLCCHTRRIHSDIKGNGWGALSRHPNLGFDFIAYQKLWRLAGVDHLHCNGIRNKFCEPDDSVIASARARLTPMFDEKDVAMPVLASGQWAGQEPDTYERVGSFDLMYLCGGASWRTRRAWRREWRACVRRGTRRSPACR